MRVLVGTAVSRVQTGREEALHVLVRMEGFIPEKAEKCLEQECARTRSVVETRSREAGWGWDGVSGRDPRNSETSSGAITTLQAREEEGA